MRRSAMLAMMAVGWSATGLAQVPSIGEPRVDFPLQPRNVLDREYWDALTKIRTNALEQRAIDGGQLTPAHSAAFQKKIDDAKLEYRRALKRNDSF